MMIKAQLIPCTVVIYDKGGTIQRAGCLIIKCWIYMASRSHIPRPPRSYLGEIMKKAIQKALRSYQNKGP